MHVMRGRWRDTHTVMLGTRSARSGHVVGSEGHTGQGTAAALAGFSRRALTGDGLIHTVTEAARVAAVVLGADGCAILELTGSEGGAILRGGFGLPSEVASMGDLNSDTVWRRQGMRSTISALVCPGGRTWGVLTVLSRRQRTFTQDEALSVETLANILAMALHRMDGEQELSRSVTELDRRIAEERRRMAEDVHDEALQTLGGAVILLDHLAMTVGGEEPERLISSIEEELQTAMRQLRRLIAGLRPATVSLGPLVAAIRQTARSMFGNRAVQVLVAGELTYETEAAAPAVIFKIAQEALSNCQRHACATSVTVTLAEIDGGIQVRIVDNGLGFNVHQVDDGSAEGHLGMTCMRERAQLAGGWWALESRPGLGTVVEYWIPLDAASPRAGVS
jgi:signal transduction histidine kinase